MVPAEKLGESVTDWPLAVVAEILSRPLQAVAAFEVPEAEMPSGSEPELQSKPTSGSLGACAMLWPPLGIWHANDVLDGLEPD